MHSALKKLLDVHIYANESLDFLRDFEWDLGTNDLIPLGKKQYVHLYLLLLFSYIYHEEHLKPV